MSLLECFIKGDLIPSVILWQSPTFLFVIDGGHRLSALKTWIEDDYGDGTKSREFFGYQVSTAQKRGAERTRDLINDRIGSWQYNNEKTESETLLPLERKTISAIITRGLPIQWVKGNADKAESSFFPIKTKALDAIEELLLKNRKSQFPLPPALLFERVKDIVTGHLLIKMKP